MAQTIDASDAVTRRANELYWSGSRTVDDIVEELGISRTGLYSAIEPIPAGLVCADCDERMVQTNRTMRDRGLAICRNCGRESAPGEVGGEAPDAARGPGFPGPPLEGEDGSRGGAGSVAFDLERWMDGFRTVPPQRVALVGGAAALGILVGAFATRLLRG